MQTTKSKINQGAWIVVKKQIEETTREEPKVRRNQNACKQQQKVEENKNAWMVVNPFRAPKSPH